VLAFGRPGCSGGAARDADIDPAELERERGKLSRDR
jgi:hypothetical protein